MSEAPVRLEHDGAIATITLSRPGRRNGVTVQMCAELHAAVQAIAATDARVVILRGDGTDFSVGADLGGAPDMPRPGYGELAHVYHASTILHAMPQVTIAAIDGGCAGAAMGWAAACDFRFVTAQARFNTAFLNIGLSGDMGLPWTLSRLLGGAQARELLLAPEKLTGEDALRLGLATRLFPREALHAETRLLAERLAAYDPVALRTMKANLLSAERTDFHEYMELESARHLHLTARAGFAERMTGKQK
ncbi:MAG: enoyl-CoA hydratase-related protein [Novosphingobium sp.]